MKVTKSILIETVMLYCYAECILQISLVYYCLIEDTSQSYSDPNQSS